MKTNRLLILTLATLGSTIGLSWGFFVMDPSREGFIFLPIVSGLLAGVYLGWFYRDRKITTKLLVFAGIGMGAGLFVGVLPGMILGTLLSIPFPDSWWSFFYLSGHLVGTFAVSVGIARGLVYLGEK